MMKRLIDADIAITHIKKYFKSAVADDDFALDPVDTSHDVVEIIKTMESVDPVKHGHWIIGDWHKSDGVYPNQGKKCSCCFRTCHTTQAPWDAVYCPWCGAKMDEKAD